MSNVEKSFLRALSAVQKVQKTADTKARPFTAKRKGRFTLESGREIHADGQPWISISREGRTEGWEADDAAHVITMLLNRMR